MSDVSKAAAPAEVLVVDDNQVNRELLESHLSGEGYGVRQAADGERALEMVQARLPDLVLLDVMMPGLSGYEVCRRIRDLPAGRLLPIIMVTSLSETSDKVAAADAGADDFISKPIDRQELVTRVRSLLRIKQYQDELAILNRTLEDRVNLQVNELDKLRQLQRFLSPQLSELVLNADEESLLKSHRRQIAVVFTDLRGFTAFSETAEPEDAMDLLREYHEVMGAEIQRLDGTVGFFAGDGLMVFFNDPMCCPDPTARAVRMALGMRQQMEPLALSWQKRGFDLGWAAGIHFGYATLGQVGYKGRLDYTAIGSVVNQASRLCAEAKSGQIIVSQRVLADVDELAEVEAAGEFALKGFAKPVPGYNLVALKDGQAFPGAAPKPARCGRIQMRELSRGR